MRIRLVFHTWLDKDGDFVIYFTNKGIELSASDFHAGSAFDARIELDHDAAADLRAALDEGYKPVFYAVAVDPDGWRAAANEAQP